MSEAPVPLDDTPEHGDRPPLHTLRLVLRKPVATDAHAIVALADDVEVARHLGRMPHPYGLADARVP